MKKIIIFITVTFVMVINLALINTSAGQSFEWVKNIQLSDKFTVNSEEVYSNDMVIDLIPVGNKVITYSFKGLLIYQKDQSSNDFVLEQKIDFTGNYGHFNPVYFTPVGYGVDIQLMDYNPNANCLYVVTPDLKIAKLDLLNYQLSMIYSTPTVIDHIKTLNGYSILKYDNIHDRLYWLVEGRNESLNAPACHHSRDTYIGFFTFNQSGEIRFEGEEFFRGDENYHTYEKTAYDVEFTSNNNYYFVSRKGEIQVFNWGDFTNPVLTIETVAGKMGHMIYIPTINKVLAFPFRLPWLETVWEPPMTTDVDFYIIDGSNPADFLSIKAPSKRITDAIFLEGTQDLVLCYTPNNDFVQEVQGIVPLNSYASFYSYNGSSFEETPFYTLTTNGDELETLYDTEHDKNRPSFLTKTSDDSFIISKTHEVTGVKYVSGDDSYTETQWIRADGAIFFKGSHINSYQLPNFSFIANSTGSGLEVFTNGIHNQSIRSGYPVYEICANPVEQKLYLFNKMPTYNTGFYIYNMNSGAISNVNTDQILNNDFPRAIGDIVYDPLNNNYLVSENAPANDDGKTRIFVYDAENNALIKYIEFTEAEYLKEMYITPDNRLIVSANMHSGSSPLIYIYNIGDQDSYSLAGTINYTPPSLPPPDEYFYYNANFCYVPQNNALYVAIGTNGNPYFPYYSVENNIASDYRPGKLLKIVDNALVSDLLIESPTEILCPDAIRLDNNSAYNGKLFIKGKSLFVYDYNTGILTDTGDEYMDITYNKHLDKIYGVNDEGNNPLNSSNLNINLYEIGLSGTTPVLINENEPEFQGQSAGLFSNPYDTKHLYLYKRIDHLKLGDEQVKLIQIDPTSIGNSFVAEQELRNTSFYFDYDVSDDARTFFHNNIQPYFDPYNSKMYFPNGGHSNVSVVEFQPEEVLSLRSGITWLSFPRLQERDDYGYCDYTTVFEDNLNIDPNNHNYLELENVPPEWEYPVYLTWNPQYNWNPQGLSSINSTLGYKLNLQPEQERELIIKGSLPRPGEPEAYVHLYAGYENWVGYFLPQTQQVFDIIPESVYDDIIEIKHQDWSIYNTQLPGPPSPDGTCPGGWKCGDNTHLMVKYGDMLIIRTYSLGSDHSFQWLPYTRTSDAETAETSYFTYDEKADYESVFIELDTTANPLEIGAFVNDTCIGAAAIGQDDSLVQLRAYTDPSNVGDIVFQQYDGLKSAPAKITEYLVEDPNTGIFNKRKIHTSEKQLYYTVSFRKDKIGSGNSDERQKPILTCLPNPVKDNCSIRYSVMDESNISLKVFDLFGRLQHVIYEGNSQAGKYHLEWMPEDASGSKLPKGVYIIRLETDDGQAQEKVMVL